MKVGDIVEKDGRRWVVDRIDLTSLPDIPPPVERNADGDSIEDMKAVQDRLGAGSVEFLAGLGWSRGECDFSRPVGFYRIAAKHAGEFNAKIHD